MVVAGVAERPQDPGARGSDVLALGFGTAVAMWAAGYVARLPFVQAPPPVVLAVLLACGVAGGIAAGRLAPRGPRVGLLAGLVAGTLNLLVLGGLLTVPDSPNRIVTTALLWVPASILTCGAVALAGALLGARSRAAAAGSRAAGAADWTAALARVAAAATLLLLAVGGLVTSHEAGLAVADWPSSFGYAMFLYPLSRMTGGIYYEHAHRLFGSLVGLTTLVLAVQVLRVETRPWVRRLAVGALAMVIVQGVLGGLRVTELSLALAVAHGVLAQVFFGTIVLLATALRRSWREPDERRRRVRPSIAGTGGVLVVLLVVQIALGAVQRHLAAGVMVHLALAAVIAPLAVAWGMRAWGLHGDDTTLRRLGLAVALVTAVQVLLGFGAFAVTGAAGVELISRSWDVALTTAHQWCGAILLACTVSLLAWSARLRARTSAPRLAPAGAAGRP